MFLNNIELISFLILPHDAAVLVLQISRRSLKNSLFSPWTRQTWQAHGQPGDVAYQKFIPPFLNNKVNNITLTNGRASILGRETAKTSTLYVWILLYTRREWSRWWPSINQSYSWFYFHGIVNNAAIYLKSTIFVCIKFSRNYCPRTEFFSQEPRFCLLQNIKNGLSADDAFQSALCYNFDFGATYIAYLLPYVIHQSSENLEPNFASPLPPPPFLSVLFSDIYFYRLYFSLPVCFFSFFPVLFLSTFPFCRFLLFSHLSSFRTFPFPFFLFPSTSFLPCLLSPVISLTLFLTIRRFYLFSFFASALSFCPSHFGMGSVTCCRYYSG